MSNPNPVYEETCGFCEYFENRGVPECRKLPPAIVSALVSRVEAEAGASVGWSTRFPVVDPEEDWCGEFRIRIIRNRQ